MIYEPMITKGIPYKAYFWKAHTFGPHWHNELEVLTCLEGECLVEIDGKRILLTPGYTQIIAGNEGHKFEVHNTHTRLMILKFGYSLLGSDYAKIQNSGLYFKVEESTPALRQSLLALKQCLMTYGELNSENEWYIRGNLFLLAAGLKHAAKELRPSESQISRAQKLARIYPVLDYIKDHYQEPITVETAAAVTGYTTTYFCRYFKNVVGNSFHQYLNHYRVSMACMALGDSTLSVGEVAKLSGFSSAKLFCRIFKEITGVTTGEYRQLPADQKKMSWISR